MSNSLLLVEKRSDSNADFESAQIHECPFNRIAGRH
jgi:hypothetical protein